MSPSRLSAALLLSTSCVTETGECDTEAYVYPVVVRIVGADAQEVLVCGCSGYDGEGASAVSCQAVGVSCAPRFYEFDLDSTGEIKIRSHSTSNVYSIGDAERHALRAACTGDSDE